MNANHIKNTAITKVLAIAMILFVLLFAVNIPAFANDVPTPFDGARIGDVYYSTFNEALVCAEDGDVITVLEDCTIYDALTIEKNITIDLSDFAITVKAMGDAITVLSKLTIVGDGALISFESDLITVGSEEVAGELTVNGGYFLGHNSAIKVVNGSAVINGGDFSLNPTVSGDEQPDYSRLLALVPFEAEGVSASIKVNGGVFHGFNPADENLNYIGNICGVTESEGRYTVLAHSFTRYTYNNDENCDHDGTETAKCDNCDVTDTVNVEGTKLPSHTFKYFKCEVCGHIQLTLLGYTAIGVVIFTVLFFLAGISKAFH